MTVGASIARPRVFAAAQGPRADASIGPYGGKGMFTAKPGAPYAVRRAPLRSRLPPRDGAVVGGACKEVGGGEQALEFLKSRALIQAAVLVDILEARLLIAVEAEEIALPFIPNKDRLGAVGALVVLQRDLVRLAAGAGDQEEAAFPRITLPRPLAGAHDKPIRELGNFITQKFTG